MTPENTKENLSHNAGQLVGKVMLFPPQQSTNITWAHVLSSEGDSVQSRRMSKYRCYAPMVLSGPSKQVSSVHDILYDHFNFFQQWQYLNWNKFQSTPKVHRKIFVVVVSSIFFLWIERSCTTKKSVVLRQQRITNIDSHTLTVCVCLLELCHQLWYSLWGWVLGFLDQMVPPLDV